MAEVEIYGGHGGVLRLKLFEQIAQSRQSARPVVLFVPEQYTLQAERDLISELCLPGLLNLDVISPTKLRTLVRENCGSSGLRMLDSAGRAMALHQALQSCDDQLDYYRRLGSLFGAVPRMERTLSEMREEGLDPSALQSLADDSDGAQKAKYQDMSIIWRAYDALLADRFDDPDSQWEDVCARLAASALWQGVDLYIYGFDTIRADLRLLIRSVASRCAAVRVLITMTKDDSDTARVFSVQRDSADRLMTELESDGGSSVLYDLDSARPDIPAPLRHLDLRLFADGNAQYNEDPDPYISVHAASHPSAQSAAIVSVLRAWHEEGIAWNRMAIALPGSMISAPGAFLSVLRENGIPFFFSQKDAVARHGVTRLLRGALTCVSGAWSTDAVMDIARSGFSSLTREEAARLERYGRLHGIERGKWNKPFKYGDDVDEMESLRSRLLAPVTSLHAALRAARTSDASITAVLDFLRAENVYARLISRQDDLMDRGLYAEAVIDRQVWNLLMNILDQLHALLGDRRATLSEMALLLSGALERGQLSPIPESEEGVAIGEIGHMLPGATDALILPGMNDGVMTSGDGSLLSDPERRALNERTGKKIGLTQRQMAALVRSDYYRTMTLPSRHLFVSYCLRDESGSALLPGEPVTELRRLFPHLRESGGVLNTLPDVPVSPAIAMEGLGPMLREVRDGRLEDLPPAWATALRALSRDPSTAPAVWDLIARLRGLRPLQAVRPDTAIRLFHGDRVSISRLECFASCPYKHFMRYGLRPDTTDTFAYSSADAGTFFHAALQEYTDEVSRTPGWPDQPLSQDQMDDIMDRVLAKLTAEWENTPLCADAVGAWHGEEYTRRAKHAASVLTRFAENSDFRITGTELSFGTTGGMPPVVLTLPDQTKIALRGQIDRLDRFTGPDGDYLRIVDLKSSTKKLIPAKMETGEQLQLMIYLRAAMTANPGTLPAGAFYFPVIDNEVSSATPEKAEEDRLKEVRFSGVALADENVLSAMDRLSPFSMQEFMTSKGLSTKDWLMQDADLRRLTEAAVSKATEICQKIRSGEISASPSVESDDRSACTYCEYAPICHHLPADERPLPPVKKFTEVGLTPPPSTP